MLSNLKEHGVPSALYCQSHRRCSKHSSILTPAFLPPGEQQALPLGSCPPLFPVACVTAGNRTCAATHTPTLLTALEESTHLAHYYMKTLHFK